MDGLRDLTGFSELIRAIGFRNQGLGFRVGFRNQGLGFRVGFMNQGLGFRV